MEKYKGYTIAPCKEVDGKIIECLKKDAEFWVVFDSKSNQTLGEASTKQKIKNLIDKNF